MEKQTVWRVQNEFGWGPYNGLGNLLSVFQALERSGKTKRGRWPTPWSDEGLKHIFNDASRLNPKTLCGFRSVKQYERWFYTQELRDLLHCAGFFLAKYEVSGSVVHGRAQTLFFSHEAKLVAVRACNNQGIDALKTTEVKAAKRFVKRYKSGGLDACFLPKQ